MNIDIIYENHPGLDERYKQLFENFSDINKYILRLELCDRNGSLSLAIWMPSYPYVLDEIIPYFLSLFPEITTTQMLEKYDDLLSEREINPNLPIVVQPDTDLNVLRYYYNDNEPGIMHGVYIDQNGDVTKEKLYEDEANSIKVTHMVNNVETVTYATVSTESELNKCYMQFTRDDGQMYYFYNPNDL